MTSSHMLDHWGHEELPAAMSKWGLDRSKVCMPCFPDVRHTNHPQHQAQNTHAFHHVTCMDVHASVDEFGEKSIYDPGETSFIRKNERV